MASIDSVLGGDVGGIALLKVLAENSFDSVLVTDASPRGNIIYANKAFKKLTGHEPSSVIGKTPRILQGPGTDKKVIERLATALKVGDVERPDLIGSIDFQSSQQVRINLVSRMTLGSVRL